ncbi:hypothetical protein FA95DRAFT_1618925 [Auriscalpium vulgare]|uniref:Uncharacterized protein n=1 Tax=Auriscalpium vulgare TaxID=40419 RepID=A0ACB8S8C5_9AGAM|nr:hypothetical protein FA95DRAFT_1618925 [Auriscalpium vulgare]
MSDSSLAPPDLFPPQPQSVEKPDSIDDTTPRGGTPVNIQVTSADIESDSEDESYHSCPPSRDEVELEEDAVVYSQQSANDMAKTIKGMYRVLDLIAEEGSGVQSGFVNKIIIAQNTLQNFVNTLAPGAYSSLTKVNFKALDQLVIKPIGIYGSKEELVRFLVSISAIDDVQAHMLLSTAVEGVARPMRSLRSGLYIVKHTTSSVASEHTYVLYWPEDTTWDDSAVPSVCRNRVTFMRYLTKMCDQILCFLSHEHASSLVWKDVPGDQIDGSKRKFTFHVAKTKEQQENVTTRAGFDIGLEGIMPAKSPPGSKIPRPFLLQGETRQGVFSAEFASKTSSFKEVKWEVLNAVRLASIKEQVLTLSDDLDAASVHTAFSQGDTQFRAPCDKWRSESDENKHHFDEKYKESKVKIKQLLEAQVPQFEQDIRQSLTETVLLSPGVIRKDLTQRLGESAGFLDDPSWRRMSCHPPCGAELNIYSPLERVTDYGRSFPKVEDEINSVAKRFDGAIGSPEFAARKYYFMLTQRILQENKGLKTNDRDAVIAAVYYDHNPAAAFQIITESQRKEWSITSALKSVKTAVVRLMDAANMLEPQDALIQEAQMLAASICDIDFLASLTSVIPDLKVAASNVAEIAHHQLALSIIAESRKLARQVRDNKLKDLVQRKKSELLYESSRALAILTADFFRSIERVSNAASKIRLHIKRLKIESVYSRGSIGCKMYGHREVLQDPDILCRVRHFGITVEHIERLRHDPFFVPQPTVNEGNTSSFRLHLGSDIRHAQLLHDDRLLLVLIDGRYKEQVSIYLQKKDAMEGAIEHGRWARSLHRDRLPGPDFLVAFNETKRMLAICASSSLQLFIYVFDEIFATLHALGPVIDLRPWYQPGTVITHACFICGSEEILLIDSSNQARVFSLIMQQFRPATLQLTQTPDSIYSSPDGSCLIIASTSDGQTLLSAYHCDTFGSASGYSLGPLNIPLDSLILSSLVDRGNLHLIALDVSGQRCRSTVIDVTRKITEYSFKAKGRPVRKPSFSGGKATSHNSLIDCFAEVWMRFPVVAAVGRQTITSSSQRCRKRVTFVGDVQDDSLAGYVADMILMFEKTARKPVGEELSGLSVQSTDLNTVEANTWAGHSEVSAFKAGEWLADLLCLIPIQIAVCRGNQFVPLKDGVVSAEFEKSLLGAEVSQIVDYLSFGWYESIFQSYMASKPVKVVSSMGEQSVGKSFTLNHLADTSFAGSAMRTTEGIWMSATPTAEMLLVALDFEGVHSLERSAQEDMFLVLFNTAISNLILFRNNFALSRDVTGLFQSFQASSAILDPAANPSLFQSTLVIIIKDVLESDVEDIAREFDLKFNKIVHEEQGANFISRLHGGELSIIPWPVITSKEFYQYFSVLKEQLDQQIVTHRTAGEFLFTLKTLMAKVKANDWAAMSQTMAAHRAKALSSLLPTALETGYGEVEPTLEMLKNLDTDVVIEAADTQARFFLPRASTGATARERRLSELLRDWDQFPLRQYLPDEAWVEKLASHLNHLVDLRSEHVREWLSSNLARFQSNNTGIEELRRDYETAIIDLKINVQLCTVQCADCHLLCIQSRMHEGNHDCGTSHNCAHGCDLCGIDTEGKACGLPAGHPGRHICAVVTHLCGKPCRLAGKPGCLDECTKITAHADEEHMCSALRHTCGEPCVLSKIRMPNGLLYSCPNRCCFPSGEKHVEHVCENRLCPVACQLCNRLCVRPHLHGILPGEHHLCGYTHSCRASCSAGVCEIDTAPQSIEATFTGRHETYQYTKYAQVTKHLPCVYIIDSTAIAHPGPHIHSMEPSPFHFCTARCESCGYYCTLPLGHSQLEHETRHGSMSNTRWAVVGPDGTSLELNGRRFASNDEGAPMMCNVVCSSMGRHVHLDYCRAEETEHCGSDEIQHIAERMVPNPERPKDAITHKLFWQRMGTSRFSLTFVIDPYTREEQANFAKCDAMCSDHEHVTSSPPAPSFCTQPLFHALAGPNGPPPMSGYISQDGHTFTCKNPAIMQLTYHVIFVVDKSRSMKSRDCRPLPNTPATERICRVADNRLGAVFSALYGFWSARHVATAGTQPADVRRDAYSILLFDSTVASIVENDLTSSPDELLSIVLGQRASHGTNFVAALQAAQQVMESHWSNARLPIVIFLSDGECGVANETVQAICRSASALGKPLSLQTVLFGQDAYSGSLRRMANVALDEQNNAPRGGTLPVDAIMPSTYSQALDTVQLAETFQNMAQSLRKPRGFLLSPRS